MMNFLIISDDLTGATDSAAAFLTHGIHPRISLGFKANLNRQAAVEVIDLDVREKQVERATQSVRKVLKAESSIEGAECRTLFLKIDSTLRGHVRAYVEALISTAPKKPILICPAFPEQGRTVEQGQVKIFGETFGLSEYGRGQNLTDVDGNLLTIFGGLRRPTKHLNCQHTPYDENSLKNWFNQSKTEPASIYLIDAPDREHMDRAIEAATCVLGQCHYAGSGGLTRSLALNMNSPDTHQPFHPLPPTLWLIGSAAKASHKQIAQLDLVKLETNAQGELSNEDQSRQHSLLQQGTSVVTHLPSPDPAQTLSPNLIEPFIKTAIPIPLLARTLFLTGGATARAALDKLGVHHIDLIDEILPGIPIGAAMIDNQICHIVLKSGGFGDDKALSTIQTYLNTHFSEFEKENL